MKIKPSERTGGVIVELGRAEDQFPPATGENIAPALPVFQLKQILVPVDFSKCTEKALLYAAPIAAQFGAGLILLHVIEPPYMPAAEEGAMASLESKEEANAELEQLRARLPAGARCQMLVRKGVASREIILSAKETCADLIILSTHGRSGLQRLVMGSTSEKIVRHAPCPVLIVRENQHEFIGTEEATAQRTAAEAEMEAAMRCSV